MDDIATSDGTLHGAMGYRSSEPIRDETALASEGRGARMFGFLKDMISAVREGASEGLSEAREEIEAEKAAKAARNEQTGAALKTRLALASPMERTITSLAAPYRETFLNELTTAGDVKRQPVYLFCMDLPEKEVTSWQKLLARDFDVDGAEEAEAITRALLEVSAGEDDAPCAVSLARACHVAAGAVGAGYVDAQEAIAWATPAAVLAANRFSSWRDYGEAFLLGERDASGSNLLGRKFLARTVKRLGDDGTSPWCNLS